MILRRRKRLCRAVSKAIDDSIDAYWLESGVGVDGSKSSSRQTSRQERYRHRRSTNVWDCARLCFCNSKVVRWTGFLFEYNLLIIYAFILLSCLFCLFHRFIANWLYFHCVVCLFCIRYWFLFSFYFVSFLYIFHSMLFSSMFYFYNIQFFCKQFERKSQRCE